MSRWSLSVVLEHEWKFRQAWTWPLRGKAVPSFPAVAFALQGHVSSLALTTAGLTLLTAPTPDAPARLEQRSWRQ